MSPSTWTAQFRLKEKFDICEKNPVFFFFFPGVLMKIFKALEFLCCILQQQVNSSSLKHKEKQEIQLSLVTKFTMYIVYFKPNKHFVKKYRVHHLRFIKCKQVRQSVEILRFRDGHLSALFGLNQAKLNAALFPIFIRVKKNLRTAYYSFTVLCKTVNN